MFSTFIAKGGISAIAAISFAVVAFILEPGWARDWWWFITGANVGFAFTALFDEWLWRKSRRQMQREMHAIGADIVRRMHEMHQQHQQHIHTLVPNLPRDDEPPRLH